MALLRRVNRLNWRLRLYTLLGLLIVLSGALAWVLYVSFSGRHMVFPSTPPRSIPHTDVNPYGANFFLAREVEPWKLEKTLQMAADAGIGWVKQHFPWEEIEPRRKGEFLDPATKGDSWAKYDQIVAACEKYGLRIVARLDRPPDWTRQDNTYKERPPDRFEDYGDFVYAFVKRYAGRVNYIQVWNEPNIFPEWGNQPVSPTQYVELLKIAYRRAKEANPNVYVLCAPLAITLGQPHPEAGKWTAMSDLTFLEEMYRAGAAAYFDIYSANAFGMDRPPEDPPDPRVLNFQRVLLQRAIMERYGDGHKAVWFNEYGWNAAPESFPPERLIWGRVSEKQQAEYTLRGIEWARREWPWAGVFMIWYFRQVGNITADRADYYFRMVDVDFTPRLVYSAVQDATRLQQSAGPGLVQETNPSVRMYGRWRPIADVRALHQSYVLSDTPGDSVTLTFRGSAVDLITRRSSAGGIFTILLDGHAVFGPGIVDLYNATPQTQVRIPLLRDALPGEHTLRLTISEERNTVSTGHECAVDAFEILSESPQSWPTLLMAGLTIAWGLNAWLLWRTWCRVRWSILRP